MLTKSNILGVDITDAKSEDVLEYLLDFLKQKDKKSYIVTPNPEIIVYANKHPLFKNILNSALIALPDGMGVMLASKVLGKPLIERISGVDFIETVCQISAKKAVSIGLLGGRDYIAEKAAECLRAKYPGVNIVFSASEWPDDFSPSMSASNVPQYIENNNKNVDSAITVQPKMDILFVAFGHPKQEEWIYKNIERLPVKVAMGVGGALDYLSGEVPRAPILIRKIGFEWLFRLIVQPRRIKRILKTAIFEFLMLLISKSIKNIHHK